MEGITVTLQRAPKQVTLEIALCFTDNNHTITLPVCPIIRALFEVFHEPQVIYH
ncbi:MAG TPA: hypothetical protein VFT87_05110 [Candidatus Saccharimonadales bacterium]|nr:hypothetical protein [Candidatus Saccharimonadales bacterium]